ARLAHRAVDEQLSGLGHEDHVPALDDHVLGQVAPLDEFVQVDQVGNGLVGLRVGAADIGGGTGLFAEPLGNGDHIKQPAAGHIVVGAGFDQRADQGDLLAHVFLDVHGDVRVVQVAGRVQALYPLFRLGRGEPGDLDVVEQRQADKTS